MYHYDFYYYKSSIDNDFLNLLQKPWQRLRGWFKWIPRIWHATTSLCKLLMYLTWRFYCLKHSHLYLQSSLLGMGFHNETSTNNIRHSLIHLQTVRIISVLDTLGIFMGTCDEHIWRYNVTLQNFQPPISRKSVLSHNWDSLQKWLQARYKESVKALMTLWLQFLDFSIL